MAFTRITTGDAGQSWSDAQAYLTNARNDPNDPTSWNFALAVDSYFHSVGTTQKAIIDGLNDLLERVDKIQTKLGVR